MFKRIVSCLIIFSMLWVDIVAAIDDEENPPPSLYPQLTPPKNATIIPPPTEKSSLLKANDQESSVYRTITPMREITSLPHSINEVKGSGSSSDEEDPYLVLLPLEGSGVKKKTCCWPLSCLSCCKKKPRLVIREEDVESSDQHSSLVIAEKGPSLVELRKQALLAFVPLLKEESDNSHVSSDLISLEELDEEGILLQKALALAQEMKGTPLEDFGNWFKGHVLDNRYTWRDWGGLFIALCMAAGTGSAMSDIVEYSIYNSFFAHHLKQYMPLVKPLARYINVSTALTALVDSASFMPEATSPSTRKFITPKSKREKTADGLLIPLAAISGIYLLLLHFIVTQAQKKFNGETGWWNSPDQVLYFSSIGFGPYLVALSWRNMRTAVSNWFHPIVPEYVKGQVFALRTLESRLDHLPNDEIDDLYDLLKGSLFKNKPSEWAPYLCKGQMSNLSKIEANLDYIALINYAEKLKNLESVEDIPATGGAKTRLISRVLATLGLPAGFGLIATSVFGVLSAFMGWKAALALSITASALGFVPEAFLQGHNVKETLDAISTKESGPKKSLGETLKDPYAWGRGAAKVIGVVWSFLQNALTNLAPIVVSLVMLIPAQLGGSDTVQTAMTGLMIGLAIPYLFSELLSGTWDMYGHAVTGMYAVFDFFYEIRDRIAKCCGKEFTITPARKKREIRRILKKTITTTVRFTPDHVEQLNTLQLRLMNNK
ncbi:MAG: hypothetical protein HYX35_05825 [Proteobacteria bacterium]|nr:hypothetical protein [Pseudomonadota bacterium]